MSRIRAVLLDLGNTLLYFDGNWTQVFAQADHELVLELINAGIDLDLEEFTSEFRTRLTAYYEQREAEFIEHTTAYVLKEVLAKFGHEQISEDILQPALQRMYTVSQAHWLLEEETIPCLEALREQGYQLAIVSNAGDDKDVQFLVKNTGIREYFDLVLTSAACGVRKPNPRIFEFALERLKISPKQAVMVGDKLGADILGAHNAGIFSIWVNRRADTPANRDHQDTIEPNAVISSLDELPELLETIEN